MGVDLILKGLLGSYTELPVPLHGTIAHWTNFMTHGDPMAFSAHRSFKATDSTRVPRDVSIARRARTASERHAITTYLSDDSVVTTIVRAWCDARVAPRPANCPPATTKDR